LYKAVDNLKKGFQASSNGGGNKDGAIIRDERTVL
jgi:hypothetical protein